MIVLNDLLDARELVTELPESVTLSRENLIALVKPAIAEWQNQTNDNPQKRHNFIKESAAITITAGEADIAAEVDAKGFRLEFIESSDIYITYAPLPNFKVKFVNYNRFQGGGRQDKFFIVAYLNGTQISFKQPSGVAMGGSFTIRSVVFPNDLTDMPKSVVPELALIIRQLALSKYMRETRGLDIPPKQKP